MKVDPRSFKGLSRFLSPSAGGPLADRALAEKRISFQQLQECVEAQDRNGRPLDELLVERGYLTREDVARLKNPALPPEVTKAAQDPRNLLGHYVLVSRAGMGGMAEVWKAWDRSLGRWVAVKYLKAEIGQPSQRIEREGRLAGQLSHPGIITIFERAEHEGRPYLVMPFVDGAPPKPPLAPKEAARVAEQVALALSHVHEHGVIHRDVKPANVLVEKGGRVLLADFGLAIPDSSGPSRWAVSGTPEYASPEQIRGDLLDVRTDIYSLGATLYHLLAGRPPFSGSDVRQITEKVLNAPVAPLKNVPRPLAKIVATAMARDREKRYPTMTAMARDLHGFVDPIWGNLPNTPRSLVLVLVAGALPWMVTGIIAWQRNRSAARVEMMESIRPADMDLARVEQLFADPEVPLETCQGAATEALEGYKRISHEMGEPTADLEIGIARCLELLGHAEDAEAHYLKAGKRSAAKAGLARICLRRYFEGRKDQDWRKRALGALDALGKPKATDPASLLWNFSSGRNAEVLASAAPLLDLTRHDDVLQMAAGIAACESGRWAEASQRFELAARLRRSDPVSLYWQGVAQAGKGDPGGAIVFFQQAISSAPPDWGLRPEAEQRMEAARR